MNFQPFKVDLGFETPLEQIKSGSSAPYLQEIDNITKTPVIKDQNVQPDYAKWGLNSQEEFDLMNSVKTQGGTAEDFTFILEDFRQKVQPDFTQSKVQETPKEDGGFLEGVTEFGDKLKFEAGNKLQESENPFAKSFGTLIESLKFVGNIPGDSIELAGELGQVITSPVETVQSLDTLATGIVETGLNKVFGTDVYTDETNKLAVQGVKQALKDNFGTLEKINKTIIENPADILTTVMGGLSGAKTLTKNANTIAKLDKAQTILNPINIMKGEAKILGAGAKELSKLPLDIGKTITAKTSGLNPDTLTQLFKNPDLIKSGLTREATAGKVVKAIDNRVEDIGSLGKEYGKLRTGKVVTQGDDLDNLFANKTKGVETKELTKLDNKIVQEAKGYIDGYKGDVTDGNLLSLRKQLDSLKYDPTTGAIRKLSPNGNRLITNIRKGVDDLAKNNIKGLKELDVKFAPEIKELNKVKDLIFDRGGNLKDNYIQQVSNLLGKGKELKLERIRKLVPEIEDEIRALKALEDVEFAKGNKVGTYFQTATLGGGLGGAAFMADPVLAVATLLITSPTVVSNIVKGAGYSAKFVKSITNKIKTGKKLTKQEAIAVGNAIKEQTLEKGAKIADNIADKVGARSKFIDDSGKSLDDFKLKDLDNSKAKKLLKEDKGLNKVGTTKSAETVIKQTKDKAKDRFDLDFLRKGTKIGEGSDRTVYDIGYGKVLKVAKNKRGIDQNLNALNVKLQQEGIIPKVHEVGKDFVIMDKVRKFEDLKQAEQAIVKNLVDDIENLVSSEAGIPEIKRVLKKYGWEEIGNLDINTFGWADIQAKNLSVVKGKPVLLDEGTINLIKVLKKYKRQVYLAPVKVGAIAGVVSELDNDTLYSIYGRLFGGDVLKTNTPKENELIFSTAPGA